MKPLNDDIIDALEQRSDCDVTVETIHGGKRVTIEGECMPAILRVHLNTSDAQLTNLSSSGTVEVELVYPDSSLSPLPEDLTTLPYDDHLPDSDD